MKISYLITCSTETDTLDKLLKTVIQSIIEVPSDEIVILLDQQFATDTNRSYEIVKTAYHANENKIRIIINPLENNYGQHKNVGIENCNGDFIFQIDGDELPPQTLIGENLHELLNSNLDIEAFAVPRINDFKGVTQTHASRWGWRLTLSPTYNRPIVNFPDFQFRIFKRIPERIKFLRRLHEKIEGYNSYSCLPPTEEYSLYHDKTIEKQEETNLKYNSLFTQEENQGHNVFTKQ